MKVEHEKPWSNFSKRLKACKENMTKWHKKTLKNAPKEINKLKKQLENIMSAKTITSDLERIKSLKDEIRPFWAQEEKY